MAMKVNLRQWFVWLMVAFVIVFIYRDPRGASDAIGPFLGDIGHFIMTPLYYLVSAVLVGWHHVWSLVLPSGSGASWALSIIGLTLTNIRTARLSSTVSTFGMAPAPLLLNPHQLRHQL